MKFLGTSEDGLFPWQLWVLFADGTWVQYGSFITEDAADEAIERLELCAAHTKVSQAD